MRGVKSEAMVMCATSPDGLTVEFLRPPPGSQPGDRVYFEGFEGRCSFSQPPTPRPRQAGPDALGRRVVHRHAGSDHEPEKEGSPSPALTHTRIQTRAHTRVRARPVQEPPHASSRSLPLSPAPQIFETVQPDFSTTEDRVATWKGVPFRTARGVVTSETVVKGTIK